jgi:RNA polymerase sigma-70 factor (ECF subfamily)
MDLPAASRSKEKTEHNVIDERKLVGRILSGERQAAEEFVAQYQVHVVKVVTGRVPIIEVEDIVHKTFMNALKSLPSYNFKKPLKHWLARIATCRCYDFWRRHNSQQRELPASSLQEYHQWATQITGDFSSPGVLEEDAKQRARDLTSWALSHLSAEDRMVLTLVHLEGYSAEEAADQLGWTTVNVRVRAYRCRRRLRELLTSVLQGEIS